MVLVMHTEINQIESKLIRDNFLEHLFLFKLTIENYFRAAIYFLKYH